MEKKKFKCGKEYWLSDTESASVDGIPVYSKRELSLMMSIKDRLDQKDLDCFYQTKLVTNATIHEILIDMNKEEEKEQWKDMYRRGVSPLSPTASVALKEIYKKLGVVDDKQ